jgi:hypothetical protein
MKKIITIKEFAKELLLRIDKDKGIECCKAEIKNLANVAAKFIGEKEIEVDWKD